MAISAPATASHGFVFELAFLNRDARSPVVASLKAAASSPAVAKRSTGRFAIAFSIT